MQGIPLAAPGVRDYEAAISAVNTATSRAGTRTFLLPCVLLSPPEKFPATLTLEAAYLVSGFTMTPVRPGATAENPPQRASPRPWLEANASHSLATMMN